MEFEFITSKRRAGLNLVKSDGHRFKKISLLTKHIIIGALLKDAPVELQRTFRKLQSSTVLEIIFTKLTWNITKQRNFGNVY